MRGIVEIIRNDYPLFNILNDFVLNGKRKRNRNRGRDTVVGRSRNKSDAFINKVLTENRQDSRVKKKMRRKEETKE
jgi:hypothetical protein